MGLLIGSAVNSLRVTRGGSWNALSTFTNTSRRSYNSLSYKRAYLGFRVASYNRCGNGVVEANEQCDDANKDANDGCDALCRFECGNGQLEPSELATARPCDDGNRTNGDGCSATC